MAATRRRAELLKAYHYQTLLHELEQLYTQGQGDTNEILRRLQDDWEQIKQAQAWSAAYATDDEAAATLCSKFAGIAGHLLEERLPRLDYINWMEAGLAAAERFNLLEDQYAHLTHLGFAHFLNQNPTKAFELCERALSLSRQHQDRHSEATALSHMGMFYMSMDQIEPAIANLQTALAIYQELGDRSGEGSALSALGSCHSHLEQYEQAIAEVTCAISCFQATHNRAGEGTALANQASSLLKLGQLEAARESLEQAKLIAEEINSDSLRGTVLANFAILSTHDQARRTSAMAEFEGALDTFRRAGDRHQELKLLAGLEDIYRSTLEEGTQIETYEQHSHVLRKLGEIHRNRQEYEEAIPLYQQLLTAAQSESNAPDQLEALIHLGHCCVLLQRFREAVNYHQQALTVLVHQHQQAEPTLNQQAECELYLSLGQAYRHLSQPREAERCYQQALAIAQATRDKDAERRASGNLGLIYVDLGRFDEALAQLERTLKLLEAIGDHRMIAHARFNLGYAYHRKGEDGTARDYGEQALLLLEQINDPTAAEVCRQMQTWGT